MHQASRSKPNRPEEDHRLYLHCKIVAQHGEPARHTRGSQLLTNPSSAGLLQGFSHIWGKRADKQMHFTVLFTAFIWSLMAVNFLFNTFGFWQKQPDKCNFKVVKKTFFFQTSYLHVLSRVSVSF